MLVSTSGQSVAVSTSFARKAWSAFAGLGAGALAAVGLLMIAPHHPISPLSLLIRALVYSAVVFTVASVTAFLISPSETSALGFRSPIVLRTASTAIWLAPLAAVSNQKSWFALVLWVVFWTEVARLAAFLRTTSDNHGSDDQSVKMIFAFPSPNLKPSLLSALGAFLCQAALVAAISAHVVIAVFLGILSTIALAWRGVWMIEASPVSSRRSEREPLYLLIITGWLIVFCWLPYILPHGEGSSLWKLFTPGQTHSSTASADQSSDAKKKEGGGSPIVQGAVFPGVIIYPEHKTRTILVAPPSKSVMGFGMTHADPFNIPFNGVYWLWRPPDEHPPATAVLQYGNPAAMSFHSTDGSSLWMEAHQNLGNAINLDCCNAIQVVIDSAEARPDSVTVELMLQNTSVTGKPSVSLGFQDITKRVAMKQDTPVSQALTFRIPGEIKLNKFDELKVGFRLKWWREDRSAKIAINRFVLIPGR